MDGQDVRDLDAAVEIAELSICEIAGESLKVGRNVQLEGISILDESGLVLAHLTTEEAVLPRFNALRKYLNR
ncbi:DUF6894 family protein [Rhizobium sp. CC-YZS058]|uniref:DUF6894 family protein n=1 Tax=Rhizobium sp. CC-YZS058 TaxID=3042153 RepID=UPI003A4C6FFF